MRTSTRSSTHGHGSAWVSAGYMAKRVVTHPEWLGTDRVSDVYSVSSCISNDFADNVSFWKHNGYWLFDSPDAIVRIATEHSIDLTGTTLFFYEVLAQQYGESRQWAAFEPEPSFETAVKLPPAKQLAGYDVVTFSSGNAPECSPLSCNGLAAQVATNSHCLLESFEEARRLIETGAFEYCEAGPFRVFAVYSVAWPAPSR